VTFRRLVVADLKLLLRNRQSLFWALAFPIIFATIFGLFNFDQLPDVEIAVFAENEQSAQPVIAGISSLESLDITDAYETQQDALAALKDGDLALVLDVASNGEVIVHVNEVAADTNRIFVPVVRSVIDEVNFRISGVDRAFTVVERSISGRDVGYYDFVLPGLVGMGVMSYAIIGLAATIAQYRAQRILRRIRATPLEPRTFVGALVVAHLLLAMIQAALILAWGVLLFGGTVRGNLLWIAVFVVLGNVTFLNIGFMVSTRAESAEAASGIGNAVSMPLMFFSGVFFPTSTLPWILPAVTAVLPLKPMVDGIRAVALDATSITELGSELAQLAGWALVTALLATRIFRFERA
jgi:ABC-2 type transport system permease protein